MVFFHRTKCPVCMLRIYASPTTSLEVTATPIASFRPCNRRPPSKACGVSAHRRARPTHVLPCYRRIAPSYGKNAFFSFRLMGRHTRCSLSIDRRQNRSSHQLLDRLLSPCVSISLKSFGWVSLAFSMERYGAIYFVSISTV